LAPDNAQILDTLAEAQMVAGQRKEATASLRHALALAPGLPSARVHLAELLAADGSKKEAADLLRDIDERSLDKEATTRLQAVKGRL
jgi:predicted Zn-dependent protease